jgi:hypothetical protein
MEALKKTLKKHRVQMTAREREYAEFVAHSTAGWTLSNNVHLDGRMDSKRITRDEIIGALQGGQVIEVKDDNRIVMRSDDGFVAVADVRTKTVVTAWFNAPSDNHRTLDLSEYTWQVDVTKFMKRFL